MPHILVAGKLHPAGIELLRHAPDVTFDLVEEISEPSYAPLIGKADGLVIRTQPMSAGTIAAADKLRIVSRHGVGYDAVDMSALNARRIPLAIVGDVNSRAVAEHAMMLILAAGRRLELANRAVRQGPWGWRNALEPREAHGKNLLILGYGRIGRHLARMADVFGMEIRAHDPWLEKNGWPQGTVSPTGLEEGLGWADVISLHLPKTDGPVLGEAEFAQLKPGTIIINTSRGGLMDEAAFVRALASGRVGAAGIDVLDAEPPAPDHPLIAFHQVILTPHNAALTLECGERMAVSSVQNVLDFFAGRLDPALLVNKEQIS